MTRHPPAPLVCVMGVSAAGKSTVGIALAAAVGVPFVDADDLHSAANRAIMASGVALTDEDRWPWLDAVAAEFVTHRRSGVVIACSALRRAYRDRIRASAGGVDFVLLHGTREVLAARAAARTGHFMPPALLDSQLATLEMLDQDERGVVGDIMLTPDDLIADLIGRLSSPAEGQSLR